MISKDFYIVDLGMHDGKDSIYYAARGFKVIAFEANPLLALEGRNLFEKLGLSIDVRNYAISDINSNEEIAFYINKKSSQWSSTNPTLGSRGGDFKLIHVKSCNLVEQLYNVCDKIHYIKIDIEGMDSVALAQVLQLPFLPQYVSIENGTKIMIDLLKNSGYLKFKFSNQKYVRFHHVPKNSIHGSLIKFKFLDHSSGCFGEDLMGRWLTYDEAILVNDALWAARRLAPNNLFGESVGWFDLHAAL